MRGLLNVTSAMTIAAGLLLLSLTSAPTNGFIQNAFAAATDNSITLRAVDSNGNEITGLFVAIQDPSFNTILSGFSPLTVPSLTSGTYYVAVYNNYADPNGMTYTFTSASSPDHPELVPAPFTITDYGGFGSITIPDDGNTYNISINGLYNVVPTETWRLNGFAQPVDMGTTVNTIKSGQAVPLKFQVFVNEGERTDATLGGTTIRSFTQQQISCTTLASDPQDPIPTTATNTGGTSLRYDATAGQFIANWKSPSNSQNTCWKLTVTTMDSASSTISALFKLTK